MFDYDQVEYRMLLDYAKATKLINLVLGGLDVHSATAELCGITRSQAKAVNFGNVYGQGDRSLAESLKMSISDAREIKRQILAEAPEVDDFLRRVKDRARTKRLIYNWLGRPYRFPYKEMSYKAPNTLIQGGAADIIRVAMNVCRDYLLSSKAKTRMVMSIHDELVFEVPEGEEHEVEKIKGLMENVFPYKYLPLTCGVEYSEKSLADKESWEV
jgi:DNA polymerase-1